MTIWSTISYYKGYVLCGPLRAGAGGPPVAMDRPCSQDNGVVPTARTVRSIDPEAPTDRGTVQSDPGVAWAGRSRSGRSICARTGETLVLDGAALDGAVLDGALLVCPFFEAMTKVKKKN